jgi:hypothetical protein
VAGNAELADALSRELVNIYSGLQTRLCADIVRRLASGMGSPDWAQDKLTAVGDLRRAAERMLARVANEANPAAATAIRNAYEAGGQQAMSQLTRSPKALTRSPKALARIEAAIPQVGAINRLVNTLVTSVAGTHLPILRESLDLYRSVVARASVDPLAGTATRRRAAQVAWERLIGNGITGFTDKAGRGWELASYVEMATRSTVAQAAVEGHLDKLGDAGLDLVTPSDSPHECARCRSWEGKVLTRAGPDGQRTVEVESVTSSAMVRVEIAGSVDEARAAGLMHPNCTHRFNAYLPGATRRPEQTENPQGDQDRQKLRALERELRRRKLTAQAVIDPAAKARLDGRVREQQAKIRAHVADTGIMRQPAREQIGQAR